MRSEGEERRKGKERREGRGEKGKREKSAPSLQRSLTHISA